MLSSKAGSLPPLLPLTRSLPEPFAHDLQTLIDALPDSAEERCRAIAPVAEAVDQEARRRFASFLNGISHYRQHPTYRHLKDPAPCWQRGGVTLRPYAAPHQDGAQSEPLAGPLAGPLAERHAGPPVLAIPSLINRAYILDLNGQRSLMRYMARHGLAPYLVDWGDPGPDESDFDIAAYIDQRLIPMMEEVTAREGRPPVVLGYCMGGLLAVAACLRRPDLAAGCIGLATPWDFHADTSAQVRLLRAGLPLLESMIDQLGELPVDILQAMFAGLDPHSIARKFQRFADLDTTSPRAKAFVGLEDWLNDGVPLVNQVARECLIDWYGSNSPAQGTWTVGTQTIDPAALTCPSLFIIPENDRIVPPQSAFPLARSVPGAEIFSVPLGHIGMVAGSAAVRRVYGPLTRWINHNFATE